MRDSQFVLHKHKQPKIQSFETEDAGASLGLLEDTVAERESHLRKFEDESGNESSDEEKDSLCTIYDRFFNEIDVERFDYFWNVVYEYVSRK